MPRLLVVHHTPSPALQAMFEAAVSGARTDEIEGVEVVIRPALTAAAVDVLKADAYLLGTPVQPALGTLQRIRPPRNQPSATAPAVVQSTFRPSRTSKVMLPSAGEHGLCRTPVPLVPFAGSIRLARKPMATGVGRNYRESRIYRRNFRMAEWAAFMPPRRGGRWYQRDARDGCAVKIQGTGSNPLRPV
jgi:hypothetical protein